MISSFETDSPDSSAIGIPNFQLMPCEEIRISLALEHYTLLNRSTSLCRDDYPEQIKSMFNATMTPDLFYNPAYAPNLPYDPWICKTMCISNYWLPKCGCYIYPEAWLYAGKSADITPCRSFWQKLHTIDGECQLHGR